jgi:hypothetical protein
MKPLTGDLIDAYHRNYLNAEQLNAWAMELLEAGKDSVTIIAVAACSDLPPEQVGVSFKRILNELNVTKDLDSDVGAVKKRVFLEEYQRGLRPGAQVLQKFDDLRREIGFPDMVGFTILGDDYRGSERVGYHTLDRKLYGESLEKEIRRYLERAGKI